MNNQEILNKATNRIEEKTRIFDTRNNVLLYQMEAMRQLVSVANEQNIISSNGEYVSAIAHRIVNFLTGAKLFPSIIDFKPEQIRTSESGRVLASNVGYTHQMIRKKGEWDEATIGGGETNGTGANADLIRGESYIRRYIKNDFRGNPLGIAYEHVPFDQVRSYYGDTDIIRVSSMTKDNAMLLFGEKKVKKVKPVRIWTDDSTRRLSENSTIASGREDKLRYGYIHYVNRATREEYEILGDTVISNFSENKYRYVYPNGETYDPFNRRIFYKSIEESFFGFGVLDMILPIIRVDDMYGNVVMKKAINEVDPLTIVSHDDPVSLDRQFRNHIANRNARNIGKPFFVKNNGVNSKLDVQQMNTRGDYQIYQFISDFITDRISMLTDINLRALLEFAPTEAQDQRRQDFQDKVNLSVLQRNKSSDSKFAKEDMIFLKSVDTAFHDKTMLYEQSTEDMGVTPEEQALLSTDGELPPDEKTVREFLDGIKEDLDYDITPRLDGVLDDADRFEINAQRADLGLLQPGTPAHAKATVDYFAKTNPKLQVEEKDILPPAPESPPMQPQEAPIPPM